MQDIGLFYLDHDPAIPKRGMLEKYDSFFRKLEEEQNQLFEMNDEFFHKYFLGLIITSHTFIALQLSKVMQTEADPVQSVKDRIRWIYEWYGSIHLWASRALEVLESQNRSRWKLW